MDVHTALEEVARWCAELTAASSPLAQLRYDLERREWALHHGGTPPHGWCESEDAEWSREVGPLLDEVASDRSGRFQRLPQSIWRLVNRADPPGGAPT